MNNLNDALAWGLAPLYLAANGASAREIGIVAGVYPALWGAGQLATGWLSDHTGRKPLIVLGMLVQAAGLALLALGGGAFGPAVGAAALLGVGTALVYPTLIAAVSDAVQPRDRAPAVGVYRFWRDAGFALGGLLAGVVADAAGASTAIAVVAALTAASGLFVAATPWRAPAARLASRRGTRHSRQSWGPECDLVTTFQHSVRSFNARRCSTQAPEGSAGSRRVSSRHSIVGTSWPFFRWPTTLLFDCSPTSPDDDGTIAGGSS